MRRPLNGALLILALRPLSLILRRNRGLKSIQQQQLWMHSVLYLVFLKKDLDKFGLFFQFRLDVEFLKKLLK